MTFVSLFIKKRAKANNDGEAVPGAPTSHVYYYYYYSRLLLPATSLYTLRAGTSRIL